jgi:hypothetical protein
MMGNRIREKSVAKDLALEQHDRIERGGKLIVLGSVVEQRLSLAAVPVPS